MRTLLCGGTQYRHFEGIVCTLVIRPDILIITVFCKEQKTTFNTLF